MTDKLNEGVKPESCPTCGSPKRERDTGISYCCKDSWHRGEVVSNQDEEIRDLAETLADMFHGEVIPCNVNGEPGRAAFYSHVAQLAQAKQIISKWLARASSPPTPTPNPWKDAVIEACVVNHLDFNEEHAGVTLGRLIHWECESALNPAVSKAAAELARRSWKKPSNKQQKLCVNGASWDGKCTKWAISDGFYIPCQTAA